jgi:hypothetical protein
VGGTAVGAGGGGDRVGKPLPGVSGEQYAELSESESELRGEVSGDAADERIRWLAINRLEALGTTSAGWDWLFRDPRDGRLWELTFPEGSLHGSGPRRLRSISAEEALARYAFA